MSVRISKRDGLSLEDLSGFDRTEGKRRVGRTKADVNQHAAVHRNRATVTESARLRFE